MDPAAPPRITKLNPKRRSGRTDPNDPRHEWARRMRLLLSPPEMLLANGDIDQEYFRPKQVIEEVEKRWGPDERDLLYQGLEEFGVGRWRKIREELLSDWDDHTLRVKTARLLGTQSLARYIGWRGDRATIDAEQANNAALGASTGCWKAGMLVEDDLGTVAAALQEREREVGPTEFTEEAAAKRRKLMSPAKRRPAAAPPVQPPAASEPAAQAERVSAPAWQHSEVLAAVPELLPSRAATHVDADDTPDQSPATSQQQPSPALAARQPEAGRVAQADSWLDASPGGDGSSRAGRPSQSSGGGRDSLGDAEMGAAMELFDGSSTGLEAVGGFSSSPILPPMEGL